MELDRRLNLGYDKLIIPRLSFRVQGSGTGSREEEEKKRERCLFYLKSGKYDSFYVGSIDWEGLIQFDSLRIQLL